MRPAERVPPCDVSLVYSHHYFQYREIHHQVFLLATGSHWLEERRQRYCELVHQRLGKKTVQSWTRSSSSEEKIRFLSSSNERFKLE